MKVAILLTGQLRTWKMCKYIIDNLKQNYDVDLFMSIDLSNKNQHAYKNTTQENSLDDLKEAVDYYKPISFYHNSNYKNNSFSEKIRTNNYIKEEKYILENDELLESSFETSDTLKFKKMFIRNEFSNLENKDSFNLKNTKVIGEQYFFVYKAYELLEQHISNTNKHYDTIIRTRFDQLIWNIPFFSSEDTLYNEENINKMNILLSNVKFDIDKPNNNSIYVFGGGVYCNYAYVNDQFFAHNMSLIPTMKNFYEELPNIISNCFERFWPFYGCWIEHFFCNYLFSNNIIIKRSVLSGKFIREKE